MTLVSLHCRVYSLVFYENKIRGLMKLFFLNEVNENAVQHAVLVAFDLVLLCWSLLHPVTLSLCTLVFRALKCFWDTQAEGTDK